jgi:hypothetical protein
LENPFLNTGLITLFLFSSEVIYCQNVKLAKKKGKSVTRKEAALAYVIPGFKWGRSGRSRELVLEI